MMVAQHGGDCAQLAVAEVAATDPHPEDLAAELYLALRQPGKYMARAVKAAIASATDEFGDPARWDRPSEWTAVFSPMPVEDDGPQENDATSVLRAELEALRYVQLQSRARKEGVSADEVAAALEAADPQEALITLLMAHLARQALMRDSDSDDEGVLALIEPEPEPEQDPYLEDARYDGRS